MRISDWSSDVCSSDLAIEKGYLTAASILDDSPVQLDTASGLYVPQDYDRAFKGPVSARTALAGSLNVPAVRPLVLVGVRSEQHTSELQSLLRIPYPVSCLKHKNHTPLNLHRSLPHPRHTY